MLFEAIEPLSELDIKIRSTYTSALQQIRLRLASCDAHVENVLSNDPFEFNDASIYEYSGVPSDLAAEFDTPHPWHRVYARLKAYPSHRIN